MISRIAVSIATYLGLILLMATADESGLVANGSGSEMTLYVIGIPLALSVLLLPVSRDRSRWKVTGLWLAFLVMMRLTVFKSPPFLAVPRGELTVSSLLPGLLIAAAVWAGYRMLDELSGFIGAIESLAVGSDEPDVRPLADGASEIRREFVRSRQHGRTLGVVVVGTDEHRIRMNLSSIVQALEGNLVRRFAMVQLARALRAQLKRTDLIFQTENPDRLIVFSPETDDRGVLRLVDHVHQVADEVHIPVDLGAAAFPFDALTFDELLSRAEQQVSGQTDGLIDERPRIDRETIRNWLQVDHPASQSHLSETDVGRANGVVD